MNVTQIAILLVSLYWLFFLFSLIGLAIDYGIKLKNNEEGNDGKDFINKTFRSKMFGLGILFVVGIIVCPLLIEFIG